MGDNISYDYSALDQACSQLLSITQGIQSSVQDLVNQVNQNKSEYLTGASAEAYGIDADKISSDFEAAAELLGRTSRNVSAAADAMADTDKRLAAGYASGS